MSVYPQDQFAGFRAEITRLQSLEYEAQKEKLQERARADELQNEVDRLKRLLKRTQAIYLLVMDSAEDELRIIRDIAEPFRYAMREQVDPDRKSDDTIIINTPLWHENGTSVTAGDLLKLLHAIYDDHPEVEIPKYEEQS